MSVSEIFNRVRDENRNTLTITEASEVIKKYKIPFVDARVVNNVDDAINFSSKIGYPVVLKIVSKDISHKTDVGGIILNVDDRQELEKSYEQIICNVKKNAPNVNIEGVFVCKMIEGGIETAVGGKKDIQFGQVIMFGLGGVFIEVLNDVALRIIPINKKDARNMIEEIKGYKILSGYRGKKYDIDALVDILLKSSKLLEENPEIKELDINPVFVLSKNAIAGDARIVID